MTFGREKRMLLGGLALLAPLPLPFNGIVGWPSVLLYAAGVGLFLRRAWADPPNWLPFWAMNLLGVIYIPIFLLDLRSLSRGLVGPVLHLGLFALLVKLCALVRERDKWQTVIGIFFVFLAAIGTSTHPTIVLYLAAYLALSLLLLTRFAIYHVLAGFGREESALAAVPLRRFVAGSTVFGVVLALPLFLFLPRVRTPFIAGHGTGVGADQESVGFSEEVSLDAFGRIRGDRNVALRLLMEGPTPMPGELRLKAATYDRYLGGSWRRSPPAGLLDRLPGIQFQIAPGRPRRWATLWLQPLRSRSVPVPVETLVMEPRSPSLWVDEGGAVSFPILPLEVRQYRVGLGNEPVSAGKPPEEGSALDLSGVTGQVAALAGQVAGTGSPLERAQRLERHLMEKYSYTLDFVGRETTTPIEDFLFRYRSGHCELFASAMVLMLRSQGIPARLVTGFLGGEYNPFEGYTMVRNENAHAWVEAYVPDLGWRVFDPTPAAGRPASGEEGALRFLQQAWDFIEFRWDRYVLTFGLYDQLRILGGLRSLWQDFWAKFRRPENKPVPTEPGAAVTAPTPAAPGDHVPWWASLEPLWLVIAFVTLALGAAALWWFRLRRPLTATTAYGRLRRRLDRTGRPLGVAAAPLAVGRETATRFPAAAQPSARVIDFYLRESFGGEDLSETDRAALAAALAEAEKSMRKAG
jgi:transglutaminase-like putative cysteine protease